MAKSKSVSSKTHTKQQLNDYANQHNPNNKAFASDMHNRKVVAKNAKRNRDFFFVDYDYSYCLNKDDY